MILLWRKVEQPRPITVRGAGIAGGTFGVTVHDSEYAIPEWLPALVDYPFENWRRRKPCSLQLLPEDQVRAWANRPRSAPTAP